MNYEFINIDKCIIHLVFSIKEKHCRLNQIRN